jgi:hypothetical protein
VQRAVLRLSAAGHFGCNPNSSTQNKIHGQSAAPVLDSLTGAVAR